MDKLAVLSAESIASIVGIIISFGLELIPGLKDKWATWKWKLFAMVVINLLVGIGIWVLVCLLNVPLKLAVDCGQYGWATALYLGLIAFASNQTSFTVASKRLPNVADHISPLR